MENLVKLQEMVKRINEQEEVKKKELLEILNYLTELLDSKWFYLGYIENNLDYPIYDIAYHREEQKILKLNYKVGIPLDDEEVVGTYYITANRIPFILSRIEERIKRKLEEKEEILQSYQKIEDILKILKDK